MKYLVILIFLASCSPNLTKSELTSQQYAAKEFKRLDKTTAPPKEVRLWTWAIFAAVGITLYLTDSED